MPDWIAQSLDEAGLRDRYDARPWYQRNDYLGWICRAKRPETQARRLHQMQEELQAGNLYMKMAWHPKR
jgi:uncharacterized protein YdeI (YjbR/CyaY-like superfamily)